jgi:hypothetical protein
VSTRVGVGSVASAVERHGAVSRAEARRGAQRQTARRRVGGAHGHKRATKSPPISDSANARVVSSRPQAQPTVAPAPRNPRQAVHSRAVHSSIHGSRELPGHSKIYLPAARFTFPNPSFAFPL